MTTEEKAKAYDEALERARMLNSGKDVDVGAGTTTCEYIFPELKEESKDERIRKDLIKYLKSCRDCLPCEDVSFYDSSIAWIEKQKYDRMKPIYDARESFESALEKAWNDYHNGYENVDKLEDDYVECAHAKGFREGYLFGIEKQKEQKPITESKRRANEVIEYLIRCGYSPVLKDDSKKEHFHIDIPRHEDDFWYSEEYKHCCRVLGEYYMEGDYGSDTYTLYIWRAKKEQKQSINMDQLKSLMLQYLQEAANEKDDADIEADTDKWARKILEYDFEQKPEEWSKDYREEDIQTRFAFYTYKDDPSTLYLSNVFVEEASRNHHFGTRILSAAEKVAETIGATTISLKVKQDSPANTWYRKNGYGYVAFEDGYNWLEKNLEYMKPKPQAKQEQKSAEWSGEDEKNLELIIDCIYEYYPNPAVKYKLKDWLKSLRPQPKRKIYQAAKHDLAIRFMNYLDENRPEGKMSLSEGECGDIDKAFKENDWAKIMRYAEKYLVQSEQKHDGNEEDYHWEGLVQLLRNYQKTIDRSSNNMAYEDVERYIEWIKSLCLSQKQERG